MYVCSESGRTYNDFYDGIYDDGEWISWDWINQQIEKRELRREFPNAEPEVVQLFQDLVGLAANYFELTGRYLQIWGELGELFAEIQYGIKRHRPGTPGSDGKLGNDFVEVKTISPEKAGTRVEVKRSGNFNKLLVVRISEDFEFEARMIDRRKLGKGPGKARVNWNSMPGE